MKTSSIASAQRIELLTVPSWSNATPKELLPVKLELMTVPPLIYRSPLPELFWKTQLTAVTPLAASRPAPPDDTVELSRKTVFFTVKALPDPVPIPPPPAPPELEMNVHPSMTGDPFVTRIPQPFSEAELLVKMQCETVGAPAFTHVPPSRSSPWSPRDSYCPRRSPEARYRPRVSSRWRPDRAAPAGSPPRESRR